MAKSNDKRVENKEKRKGLLSYAVSIPAILFFTLFISAIISTAIEWCGMAFDWWDIKGIGHSQAMVTQELTYLNVRLEKNVMELFTGYTVKEAFDLTVGTIAGWLRGLGLLKTGSATSGALGEYMGAAVNMFLLTFIRFFVFTFSLVMFVFFGLVGFVIGVFERDKRRAGGGRESSVVFKLARTAVAPSISIAAFLYLAWPNSIDPVFIVFPFAVVFGTAVAYTSAAYKKYI